MLLHHLSNPPQQPWEPAPRAMHTKPPLQAISNHLRPLLDILWRPFHPVHTPWLQHLPAVIPSIPQPTSILWPLPPQQKLQFKASQLPSQHLKSQLLPHLQRPQSRKRRATTISKSLPRPQPARLHSTVATFPEELVHSPDTPSPVEPMEPPSRAQHGKTPPTAVAA